MQDDRLIEEHVDRLMAEHVDKLTEGLDLAEPDDLRRLGLRASAFDDVTRAMLEDARARIAGGTEPGALWPVVRQAEQRRDALLLLRILIRAGQGREADPLMEAELVGRARTRAATDELFRPATGLREPE
jgi:hypothetical protein